MNKIIFISIFFLLAPILYADVAVAVDSSSATTTAIDSKSNTNTLYTLYSNKNITVDVVKINSVDSDIGVDYKIDLESSNFVQIMDKNINYSYKGEGFISTLNKQSQSNSILNNISIQANFPGILTTKVLSDSGYKHEISLFDLYWNFNLGHESTQDFTNYDLTIGSALSMSTTILSNVLNGVGKILGANDSNNGSGAVDLDLGYNYVFNMDNVMSKTLSNANSNRIDLVCGTHIGILKEDLLFFIYKAYYEANASDVAMAFKQFFQAKYEHLILDQDGKVAANAPVKFALTYTYGALPPNYVTGTNLGAGITLDY